MGLIKSAKSAIGSTLHDQWKDEIRCEELTNDVLMVKKTTDTGVISNGSSIVVAPGQCAILYDNGRVIDATAEEGVYEFDDSSTPSFFAGQFGPVFKEMWERFTYNGESAKQQAVFFFNIKEIMDNKFGTPIPVPFQDWSHPLLNEMTNTISPLRLEIKCFGNYTFKVANPAIFMNMIAGVSDTYTKDDLQDQIKSEIIGVLQNIINELGNSEHKVPVLELPSKTDEIKQIIVKSNITITAYHYQNKYAIAYNAGENGKVSGITNEEVAENSSPLGTTITPNTGYEFSHWIANTNLTLTNGTIIQTGQPVSVDNLKQVVVTTTITFTAQYTKATYTINYTSNEYGTITGITTETKKYLESPTGTTITVVNSEYSFSHWIANKDVQLKDETTIKKGEKITPENISNIIVNSNITFTAQYKKNKYTIYYNSIDDIKIVGQTKEEINNNSSPTGTTVEANNQQKNVAWSCDKDVQLQDGTTIKAGSPISPEQLTKIIVEDDLTFTANYREDIEVLIPDTSLNVATIIIVISSILILIGSAIIIKNLEKKK